MTLAIDVLISEIITNVISSLLGLDIATVKTVFPTVATNSPNQTFQK